LTRATPTPPARRAQPPAIHPHSRRALAEKHMHDRTRERESHGVHARECGRRTPTATPLATPPRPQR
jgi:hypothetical protein